MPGRPPTVTAGLLERDSEIERLEQAIAAAVEEAGSVVAVEGEAGIGKSSLLAQAERDRERRRHARTARARRRARARVRLRRRAPALRGAARRRRRRPIASAGSAGRRRARRRAVLSSAEARARAERPDPSSILHGLYWLSANLAADQPLLICIDDAHWADAPRSPSCPTSRAASRTCAVVIVYASRVGEGASERLPAVAEPELRADGAAAVGAQRRRRRPSSSRSSSAQRRLRCRSRTPAMWRRAATRSCCASCCARCRPTASLPDDASAVRVAQIAPRAIARATLARLRRLGAGRQPARLRGRRARHRAPTCATPRRSAQLDADVGGAGRGRARDGVDPLRRAPAGVHPPDRAHDDLRRDRRPPSARRGTSAPRGCSPSDGAGDVALAPHLLAAEPSGDPWVVERPARRGAAGARRAARRRRPARTSSARWPSLRHPRSAAAVLLALGAGGAPRAQAGRRSTDCARRSTARPDARRALRRGAGARGRSAFSDRATRRSTLGIELLAARLAAEDDGAPAAVRGVAGRRCAVRAGVREGRRCARLARYADACAARPAASGCSSRALAFGAAHARRLGIGHGAARAAGAADGARLLHRAPPARDVLPVAVWALVLRRSARARRRLFTSRSTARARADR